MTWSKSRKTGLVLGTAVAMCVGIPGVASAAVATELVGILEAATGTGWAEHPDQTAGGHERFVEGPLTPPAGRGSLEMSVDSTTDRALIFTVPSPGDTLVDFPGIPVQIASPSPTSWADTSAEYSTLTVDTTPPIGPALKFVGYQGPPTPGSPLGTGFTTLTFEPWWTGMVEDNVWQTWTVGPDSIVWQTNANDGFCGIASPCTLSEFQARYPTGYWLLVQLGVGTGPSTGSRGFVDAVTIAGGEMWDFEAAVDSTATVTAGAATATGGTATVGLVASPNAVGTVVFTITTTAEDGTVTTTPQDVPAGETASVDVPVPFGATTVSVTVQGVEIASGIVTFAAPEPSSSSEPTPTESSEPSTPTTTTTPVTTTTTTMPVTTTPTTPKLSNTGPFEWAPTLGVAALLLAGGAVLVVLSVRRSPTREQSGGQHR